MIYPRIKEAKGSPAVSDGPDHGKAQEAGRNAEELLAMLAHELRNPLTAIRTALGVLRHCGDDPAMRERVEGILDRQTKLMSCLIDDLLDLFRVRQGKVQLHKQSVDLAALVGLALETVRPCIEQRGHQLEVTLPPEPITLEGDPTRLEQVLTNLLSNAAKYTESGGRIWLTVEQADDIVLRVRDTGVGIAPEMLPHIFDLFWQSPRLAPSTGGLGIGLTLVRQFVEMHGGQVSARSAGPGQGSEFVVRLPRTPSNGEVR